MKKHLTLFFILFCSYTVFGQQDVDYILKAKAYIETGRPELAINLLSSAIDEKRDSRFFMERAEAYVLKGDYSSAISDYNESNIIIPSSGEYGLSRIYALKGDAATALYHLEMNLNSPFRKGEKVVMLDPAFATIENRPEWRQFWKKERYNLSERNISEIEYYVAAGKSDEAKAILSELKESSRPGNDILYAEALVNQLSGKYPEVIKVMVGLVESDPSNEKYLRVLAKTQVATSNMAGASVTYSRLIDLGVPDPKLLILRAECYKRTGETDKALSDIQKYLDYYPSDREALSLAGKVEAAAGDHLKALEYFSTNLKVHPNDAECYIDRANSYFVSKSWEWAIKDYSMSLDLDPGNSEIWLNKGIALLNSGSLADACHDFRKSFSMGNKRASGYISRNCIK